MKDDHKKTTLKVWFRSVELLKDDDEILEKKGYIKI